MSAAADRAGNGLEDEWRRPQAVALFDLDGTLTDPYPGITRSVRYAMEKLGRPLPADADLAWVIGPPLSHAFRKLLDTTDESLVAAAVASYRERYGTVGLYENAVYPGIEAALDRLAEAGIELVLATSKVWVYAERILAHFGLARRFRAIHGSELDGTRAEKPALIRYIVETEHLADVPKVMIGDRHHDVDGAAANGIGTIGVGWGYGGVDELTRAGAKTVVERVVDLPPAVVAELG